MRTLMAIVIAILFLLSGVCFYFMLLSIDFISSKKFLVFLLWTFGGAFLYSLGTAFLCGIKDNQFVDLSIGKIVLSILLVFCGMCLTGLYIASTKL